MSISGPASSRWSRGSGTGSSASPTSRTTVSSARRRVGRADWAARSASGVRAPRPRRPAAASSFSRRAQLALLGDRGAASSPARLACAIASAAALRCARSSSRPGRSSRARRSSSMTLSSASVAPPRQRGADRVRVAADQPEVDHGEPRGGWLTAGSTPSPRGRGRGYPVPWAIGPLAPVAPRPARG